MRTPPWRDERSLWPLLALIGVMLVSLFWLVDSYFESMWDAVVYVLTTRSLVAGEGYALYGEPFHLRPPGFSLLFAPILALFPELDVAEGCAEAAPTLTLIEASLLMENLSEILRN